MQRNKSTRRGTTEMVDDETARRSMEPSEWHLRRPHGPRTVALQPVPFFIHPIRDSDGDSVRFIDTSGPSVRPYIILAGFSGLMTILGAGGLGYELLVVRPPAPGVPLLFTLSWLIVFMGTALASRKMMTAKAVAEINRRTKEVSFAWSTAGSKHSVTQNLDSVMIYICRCRLDSGVGLQVFEGEVALLAGSDCWQIIACSKSPEQIDEHLAFALPEFGHLVIRDESRLVTGHAFLRWLS